MAFTSTAVSSARNRLRRVGIPALLGLLALPGSLACHRGPGTVTPKVTLTVSNRGFFDVNVFVIRSVGGASRRLGMVAGNSGLTFQVPETELQAGQRMVVQVRTIGAPTVWTSPALTIGVSTIARLDVITSSSGDLGQSQFYTQR